MSENGPLRIGIAGPVGAGKTSLTEALIRALKERFEIGVVTNDIYTREDADALVRAQVLPSSRIRGVETGGCPHTAIREDCSINLAAIDDLCAEHPGLDIVFIESGGDNLTAIFSPELADIQIFVIDCAMGQDIPRKKGPGLARSDFLVINKCDLAPYVGVDLERMAKDAQIARGARPFFMIEARNGKGVDDLAKRIVEEGGFVRA